MVGLVQKKAASTSGTIVHGQTTIGRGTARASDSQKTATTKNPKYVHPMSRDRSKATTKNATGDSVAVTATPISSQAR